MGAPRNDAQAAAMYALYQGGLSLEEVAASIGKTRQTVYEAFRRRGWPMRTRLCKPTVAYRGDTFVPDPDGYYRRTHGDRRFLHQLVWEDNHGPIPPGHEIHHTDENKANNDPANLECLTPEEHGRRHNPLHPIPARHCRSCGAELVRRIERTAKAEVPAALAKRLYCNTRCATDERRGKPRGWSPVHV